MRLGRWFGYGIWWRDVAAGVGRAVGCLDGGRTVVRVGGLV